MVFQRFLMKINEINYYFLTYCIIFKGIYFLKIVF